MWAYVRVIAALGRPRHGAARSWGMILLETQDKPPPNSQPRGRKKDQKLIPLSGIVFGPMLGPSKCNSIGRVEHVMEADFRVLFGSGFLHDFNISMARVGCLAVAGSFRGPGARVAAKAKAKAKSKAKAKAKAAA